MSYFLAAYALCLNFAFWGMGLALLVLPDRWRRCWPGVAPAFGVALQSAVVWAGAHAGLKGTDSYGWWAVLAPALLLGFALRKTGMRQALRGLGKWWAIGVIMTGCLAMLTLPLAWRADGLTTASLGSCDAADYAAGARVFKEFAHSDREGFLGLTEVVSVGSTDNFFDFWLKLNHFTPSALIALNGSWSGKEPYELTGVLTVVLLVLVIPVVYLVARSLFGFRPVSALWLGFIHGISPIGWYAAYHVAPAQLIAAMGIGLVTWLAWLLWRDGSKRGAWRYFASLTVAFSLLWGAYNFIIVVCLAPACAIVAGYAWAEKRRADFSRWAVRLLLPMLAAGVFYYERVAGLVERFLLFAKTDFGWRIAPLLPEGWLGIVTDAELSAWQGWCGITLSSVVIIAWVAAWLRSLMQRSRRAWLVPAAVIPVMAGYAYLQWRGWALGSNASYDAYKLFAVFYPVLLPGFCGWLHGLTAGWGWRVAAWGMLAVVTLGNVYAASGLAHRMSYAPLKVSPALVDLQQVERTGAVDSVNLRIRDMWDRLWANQFLLRKPQYFESHSYEGRLNTPLRGTWDLNGGLIQVRLPGNDFIQINDQFALVRRTSPWYLHAKWGAGWHGIETFHARRKVRWNWSKPAGEIVIQHGQSHPLRVRLHLKARALRSGEIQVWLNGEPQHTVTVGRDTAWIVSPEMHVPPGASAISLRANRYPRAPGGTDLRELGLAAYGIVVEVLADDAATP